VSAQPKEFLASPDLMRRDWTLQDSLAYTRWLSTHHYENFHVVSVLLPGHLHQDFFNVYSFCRWADDLGDEIGDPAESLRLLGWWGQELQRLYRDDQASHPVFVALRTTIAKHRLPPEPFSHLIDAFVQDQTVTRYADWDGVLDYCTRSANPVGRLVLMLCGYRDERRFQLSDATCTALQLANFWQDVTVDLLKDRIYLPLHLFAKHGYTVEQLFRHEFTPAFRLVMIDAVDRARQLFEAGLPLVPLLDRRLALDIDLFSRGGLRVLDKIRHLDYNVLARRPAISKTERLALLLRSLLRVATMRAA
jgi:squalene synthase HpnC